MMNFILAFISGVITSLLASYIYALRNERIINLLLFRSRFKKVTGINRVDLSMQAGITPELSLKLCKNNIRFLGVAANKLVTSSEFNDAIQRCNRGDISIKFLLSDPENPILKYAAKRAGKNLEEYKKMVHNTLERIRDLIKDKGYNIEVRLYKSDKDQGPPSFRLFFIDNNSVLVSYYIFGEGNGLEMPQIQIEKDSIDRDTANFYYAFNHYFNSLWDSCEPLSIIEYNEN
jgi:hypothetical protein